jgi:hypothetical protein
MEVDVRDCFNRLEFRLERLDAALSQLEKRLNDSFGQLNARFEGLKKRLAYKTNNWVVSLWERRWRCAPLGPSLSRSCGRKSRGEQA